MAGLSIDAVRSAMLSMDLQTGLVSIYARDDQDIVNRAAALLKQARASGMKVIHVKVGFRPGLPEVSSRNVIFGAIKASEKHQRLFQGDLGAIHQTLAPEEGDIVVAKSRVSAFRGTDLEMILRASGIDTLILFGIATSGVVLSTLLEAFDTDYRLFVVKDCCADLDSELHKCLTEKLFPTRATVVTSAELLEDLRSA